MKKPLKKYIDSFLDKPITVLVRDDRYMAFSGSFPTGGLSSQAFVFTPYVIRMYAQHSSENKFVKDAIEFAEQFDNSKVIVDFPYIHFFEEEFLILFKLKMTPTSVNAK